MKAEPFLLVSLKEDKAKKLAQVITNESCKQILEFLAEREGTESEIAEKLSLPLSTVHYNLKQLVESGLVLAEEFHYSKKGKEVNHYKLANKYIIIAPKSTFGLKERLRQLLPVLGIGLVATVFLKFFYTSVPIVAESASKVASDAQPMMGAAPMAQKSVEQAGVAMGAAPQVANQAAAAVPADYTWLWFLVGFVLSLSLYLILQMYFSRKE